MSHYSEINVEMKDETCLVEALINLGFKREQIEVHSTAKALYGYQGDLRNQKANIIIRRKNVGSASNDIGFEKKLNGTYVAWISDYDKHKYDKKWIGKLKQSYTVASVKKGAKIKGFIVNETRKNNSVRLVLTRY